MAATLRLIGPITITAGTPRALTSTTVYAHSVLIQAASANTGNVYLQPVSATTLGIAYAAGEKGPITYDIVYGANTKIDLSQVYFDAEATGYVVKAVYFEWTGG